MAFVTPVPAEITLPPMSTTDTVHDLMARRRDAAKNRMRYHLTETDCVLLCTHGVDKYFKHGEIIAQEGQPITTVYRIKSGRICLQKDGRRLYNLTHGFFVGEGLFIHHEDVYNDYFGAALIANGPVTITEVNIPFVRELLEADKELAFKIYRHIAGKLSALLLSILGSVAVEEYIPSPKSEHTSPTSTCSSVSSRSDSQGSICVSTETLQREGSLSSIGSTDAYTPSSIIVTEEMVKDTSNRPIRNKLHRLTGKLKEKTPFKVYTLNSGHMPVICQLTSHKIIIITGSGIKSKRKIKYNKILDISRTGATTATIIYGVQARTLFFKTEEELTEFCGIVTSLISSENKQIFTTQIAPNLIQSPPPVSENPHPPTVPPEHQAASDKEAIHQLATRQDLKQGEFVVTEGDLYQRIYIVASGELHMKKKGRHLVTLKEGEVFGVLTLFHLRPSILDVEVASDTATLLIIPGYKVAELATSNFPLAVRIYKKAAQMIYSQVGQILKSREEVVEKFSDCNFIA